jgi:hypothetical protein
MVGRIFCCDLFCGAISSTLHSIGWYDELWIMNWDGFGRKNLWHNWDTIPTVVWMNWGKPWKSSVKISEGPSWESNHAPPEYKSGVWKRLEWQSLQRRKYGKSNWNLVPELEIVFMILYARWYDYKMHTGKNYLKP